MNQINERFGRSGRFSRSQLPTAGMLLLISCGLQAEPIRGEVPQKVADIFLPNPEGVTVETWVQNLEIPWSLAFLTNGDALVSERPSRIQRIPSGQNKPQLYIKLDKVAHADDGGLMGLALDPQFSKKAFVYAMHNFRKDDQLFNRVVRLRHQDETGVFTRVVLDNIPGANVHIGGRIAFGPDGMLYIGTGDL